VSPTTFLLLVVASTIGAAIFGVGLGLCVAVATRWVRQVLTADTPRLDALRTLLNHPGGDR